MHTQYTPLSIKGGQTLDVSICRTWACIHVQACESTNCMRILKAGMQLVRVPSMKACDNACVLLACAYTIIFYCVVTPNAYMYARTHALTHEHTYLCIHLTRACTKQCHVRNLKTCTLQTRSCTRTHAPNACLHFMQACAERGQACNASLHARRSVHLCTRLHMFYT